MITVTEAATELLARRKARRQLSAYIQYTNPKYKVSAFSETVCSALDKFIEDMQAGIRPVLILAAPPQHGKLCSDDTPVLTVDGWKTHGELLVGDTLFAPDGSTCRVIALSDKAEANCRIEMSDGSVVYCHENHEWAVRSRDKKREMVISARDMMRIGKNSVRTNPLVASGEVGERGSRFNYQLPLVTALGGTACSLPVAPYTLGAWLGDGTRTAANISGECKDIEIVNGIIADGYPVRGIWVHRQTMVLTYSFSGLWRDLKVSGVTSTQKNWKPKHIPDAYYTAPLEARLQLLAGLIDTDGYVYQKNGRVVFTTAELELAESVARLVAAFGWRATTVKERARTSSSGIVGKKDYYVVGFNPDMQIPCRLERKRNVLLTKRRRIAIKSIEFGDWGKVGHCIQVDREDGMYLVGYSLIPTHNSEIVSRKLPPYLMGRFPEWRIAAASYSATLAGKMAMAVRRNLVAPQHQRLFPPLTYRRKYVKDTTLEFNSPTGNGSYIGDGIGGGFTGSSADIFIIDDPIKNAQEALSETTKEGLWEWYQSTAKTRMSENSGLIVMATRWAMDDLSARIEETHRGDTRLNNLRFPAINLPSEVGYDPKLPEGALVPELHSMEQLREFKREGSSDYWWSAMYQQSPKALGGNVFKEHGVQYYLPKDLPAKFDKVIASWDCTFKDTDGTDYVVGQVWGKYGANSYLLDQVRARMSFSRTVAEVVGLKNKWPSSREILIEDKANGPAVIDTLKSQVAGLIPIEPDGSKLARAHAVTSYWEAHNVWLPDPSIAPWIKDYVNELTAFPAAANDDQVDATSQALRRLYPLHGKLAISQEALNRAMGRGV